MQYIKVNGEWREINARYKKENGSWVLLPESGFPETESYVFGGHISTHILSIVGPAEFSGTSSSYNALYDSISDVTTAATWSIESGSAYVTMTSDGVFTILPGASQSTVVISVAYSGLTASKTLELTYHTGTTAQTETEIVVDGGNTATTTTIVVENEDGSSSSEVSTVVVDESGNTVSTTTGTTETNADGSYTGSTTTYDAEGNPTEGINESGDTNGNVSTQQVEYDESGNTSVVGFEIDTTASSGTGKEFDGTGINTEFVPFCDDNCGFVCHIRFESARSDQPRPPVVPDIDDSGSNYLYTVMGAKSPFQGDSSWPGFEIRWNVSKTNASSGSIQFRYSGAGASTTTGKNLSGKNAEGTGSGNFYDLTITYDPQLILPTSRNTFSVTSANGCITSISTDVTFETTNIDFTIGYAFNTQGNPHRHSNVTVYDFSITKICSAPLETPDEPVIACDGEHVTITCDTENANIYYRLNQSGNYIIYSTPITITADTVVQAYSELMGQTSNVVTETCVYDNGVSTPVISCDGEEVVITCQTGGASIYYRLDETGNFVQYSSPISITADTIVEAYAEYDNKTSQTARKVCRISHDYSEDYLTFKVLTSGDIMWKATGSTASRTIEYSINNGAWTSVTSTTGGTAIPVVVGDSVRFRGSNNAYSADRTIFSAFSGGTATYNVEGNAMSMLYGDNFENQVTLPANWALSNLFNTAKIVSAENLVLPATAMTNCGYRAMFAHCTGMTIAPELPATVLAASAYTYMFQDCVSLQTAPDLLAPTLANYCYTGMFDACPSLNYIRCLATNITATNATSTWVSNVAVTGTFVKEVNNNSWNVGINGIPVGWVIQEIGAANPSISCDGVSVTIVSDTPSADIYYRLNQSGSFTLYDSPIVITADTVVEAYAEVDGMRSGTVTQTCVFDDGVHAPVISCDGKKVTITCDTAGSNIYYKLDDAQSYDSYYTAITITADTVVYAYAELSGDTSIVVSRNCIYDDSHDYSLDYLTFNVLTTGTIGWKAYSGVTKTVQYSINDGAWTSWTSTSGGSTISVTQGDVVRLKGSNTTYASSNKAYSGFEGGTATYNIEGNIMSLVNGDNFEGTSALTGTYNFCSIFKLSNTISAENLILPTATLTQYCYRAMFSNAYSLEVAPELPATTLAQGCYWYMFENCAIAVAPDLPAATLVREAYGQMFLNCHNLNYIKCLATAKTATDCLKNWVSGVSANGIFVKAENTTWTTGNNAIPTGWVVYEDEALFAPEIAFDGDEITMTCQTVGASIYYNLSENRNYTLYTGPITVTAITIVNAYSSFGSKTSPVVSKECEPLSNVPLEYSNRSLGTWKYGGQNVEVPYSVNAIDGHSSNYAKGTFNFETEFNLRAAQPAYLWFQHADQSASVYIDDTLVQKHWGGYTSFFVDISNYTHQGTNNVKVALKNNEGNNLAPAAGDFNFNATLGNVKLLTSPVLPSMNYGYDGFHVTSDVCSTSATVYVRTSIPTGATVVCTIDDGNYHFSDSGSSTNSEMTFSTTITGANLHLWGGTEDPHLYTITLEIYYNGDLYHRFQRPYGLRYYRYYVGDDPNVTYNGQPYTGFTLNGQPYFLRGVCMHDDLAGKANALNASDYTQEFAIVHELGCNFLRLAHYPHPKEVYDWCDQLGIIVQTEAPCVNKLHSTMGNDYFDHLIGQYDDMVRQHYNHPCICFWGLSNETTTDDRTFAKAKIEQYVSQIKTLDSERLVGYVMSHSYSDPLAYYYNPTGIDWVGGNIYVGWYIDKTSNDPTSQLTTRVNNIIRDKGKALAFSEYGCGGTQRCHSENFTATTTTGNYERHDIEYQMWLHEGHIASIRNFPQLLFTAEWQLFDIAVSNRNEGYTVCLDGENTSTDDNLRRLNNKGLVERDHITKKDTFYVYKAEWNHTDLFVHICGKDYTKMTDRVIKCYTNDGSSLSLYVNGALVETVGVTDNIASFSTHTFSSGDVVRVDSANSSDTFTF